MRFEKRNRGFTLVELLIYIALFGVLSTVIYNLFIQNFKTHFSQQNSMAMTQDLRASLGLIFRELRLAGYDPQGSANSRFLDDTDDRYDTDADSIHFTMDINNDTDGYTPDGNLFHADEPNKADANEDINYYLYTSGGIKKLGRRTGSSGNPQPVAENISGLTFTYTFADGGTGVPDETDGDATNDLDDIRSVQITVTAETAENDPLTKQKKTKAYTTMVKIRNLGF